MTLLYRQFNVAGIMVLSADNQIFEAPRAEQLAILQKIPSPRAKWPLAVSAR